MRWVSLTHPELASFFSFFFFFSFNLWGVSLTHPMLSSFFFSFFNLGSFSYTSCAGFIFKRGVSFTHPVLALVLSWEFLLHIPACFACVCGGGGGGEFLLDIPCWFHLHLASFSYTLRVGFIFIWGVSLTHPVLDLFFCRKFLLHIPCLLYFSVGSFSYTSRAGFIFIWGVSLTHPMLVWFLCGEFLLHILSWLNFYAGASFTHPVLAFFFYLGSFSYTSLDGFF